MHARACTHTKRKQVTFMDDVVVAPSCENSTLAGVHYGVGVYSYLETGETSGLAEGEAIKLFSLFYNEEKAGNELFDKIEVCIYLCDIISFDVIKFVCWASF